ncbi:hypothetical protein [Streptosporangium roseum]|uniref:hypothetical protein n=1 Tax=Streptosporangium roseum TaxID=2001 RepID=UPI0018CC3DF6|nr:hypothetical protein [Streptosporangium roseum]
MTATEPVIADPGATAPAMACCSATALQTCCPPEDKGECCGAALGAPAAEAPRGCGCR